MLTYIHSHTTDTWPAVPLGLVLVISATSLQDGLVNTTTSSNHPLNIGEEMVTLLLREQITCKGDQCFFFSKNKSPTQNTWVLLTNNSSVSGGDDLLGAWRQLDSGFLSLWVVRDDSGVVSWCAGQLASVTGLLLHTADDGSLRHRSNRENITNVQLSCGEDDDKYALNWESAIHLQDVLRFKNQDQKNYAESRLSLMISVHLFYPTS